MRYQIKNTGKRNYTVRVCIRGIQAKPKTKASDINWENTDMGFPGIGCVDDVLVKAGKIVKGHRKFYE